MGFCMFLSQSGRFNCPYAKALYAQKPRPQQTRREALSTKQFIALPAIFPLTSEIHGKGGACRFSRRASIKGSVFCQSATNGDCKKSLKTALRQYLSVYANRHLFVVIQHFNNSLIFGSFGIAGVFINQSRAIPCFNKIIAHFYMLIIPQDVLHHSNGFTVFEIFAVFAKSFGWKLSTPIKQQEQSPSWG